MTHIPRAICTEDKIEMRTSTNGVLVEMEADFGPYYKIFTDEVKCPVCKKTIMLPGQSVLVEHYQAGEYEKYTADLTAKFA